jgi:hypothetical protein
LFANSKLLVLLYLAAIVLANVTVAAFGPAALSINAFVLIGLDLSCRDRLHDSWRRDGLVWKMGLLILSGSLLSWLLSPAAGRVATASLVSFALAATGDALVYQLLHRHPYLVRSNGSNVVGAMVDSLTFPTLAFGEFSAFTSLLQFAAKFLGGFLWSLLLNQPKHTVKGRSPQPGPTAVSTPRDEGGLDCNRLSSEDAGVSQEFPGHQPGSPADF